MNIGIVSTRLAGLDGVSLETTKWTTVLERMGHKVFYCAGKLERDGRPGLLVEEMMFLTEENQYLHRRAFQLGSNRLDRLDLHHRIEQMAAHLQGHLEAFIRFYDINMLITQNAQALPVNLPLGVALNDLITEYKIPTIGHHHDFYWERERFKNNRVQEFLNDFYPPILPTERHVVINSPMGKELHGRKGLVCTVVPNVFDFANPPPGIDEYNSDFRETIGLSKDDVMILQPTRIVRRKAIERSVDLVKLLGNKRYKLVITGSSGDEGFEYEQDLRDKIKDAGIEALFIRDHLAEERCIVDGHKCYSLWDTYAHADFVTYPSEYEGFGNALIETMYFRKPLMVNRYSVYEEDIAPTGVDAIEIWGEVTQNTADAVHDLLESPQRIAQMVENNYEVGCKHFSYEVLESKFIELMHSF